MVKRNILWAIAIAVAVGLLAQSVIASASANGVWVPVILGLFVGAVWLDAHR